MHTLFVPSDVTFHKNVGFRTGSGLDSRVRARGQFGFRPSGSGFCQVFTLSYITDWGSGLVLAYVEKSGSGFGL